MKLYKFKRSFFLGSALTILLISTQFIVAQTQPVKSSDFSSTSRRQNLGSAITVTAPTISTSNGSFITVSVLATDTTGLGVTGYNTTIRFDPSIIVPVGPNAGCSLVGTIFATTVGPSNICNIFPGPDQISIQTNAISSTNGAGSIINITFQVIGTPGSVSPIDFVYFTFGEGTPSNTFVNGSVTVLSPTAAHVSVEGQVLTAGGSVIRNATVIVIDDENRSFTARTNTFGFFRIGNLDAGRSYIISAVARGHSFPAQAVTLNQQATTFNLIAEQ
jgi:hypothetical protein